MFRSVKNDRLFCKHCYKELNPKTCVWLELSWRTGKYYNEGIVPEEFSQGFFSFGKACAKKVALNKWIC